MTATLLVGLGFFVVVLFGFFWLVFVWGCCFGFFFGGGRRLYGTRNRNWHDPGDSC